MEQRKRCTVYVPQEMAERIEASLGREGTWQEWAFRAIQRQFIEQFEKGVKPTPTPPRKYAEWHEKLDLVMDGGGEKALNAVRAFFGYTLPGEAPRPSKRPQQRA